MSMRWNAHVARRLRSEGVRSDGATFIAPPRLAFRRFEDFSERLRNAGIAGNGNVSHEIGPDDGFATGLQLVQHINRGRDRAVGRANAFHSATRLFGYT